MAKGHTNNPNGRPASKDKKIMIGIYAPESIILNHAITIKDKDAALRIGKDNVRKNIKRMLGIE